MTPFDVHARLVAIFPEFEIYWNQPDNYFIDQDGAYTLWGIFAQFSYFVRERYASLQTSALNKLGNFIEYCMKAPDSDLDNAVATCFLESISGEEFTSTLATHLGNKAREFLSQFET
jgi:hypothetical protein